jgi:hypothetical protein
MKIYFFNNAQLINYITISRMEFTNHLLEESYSYLDSIFVSIKNNIYDVFMDLHDDDDDNYGVLFNKTNNTEKTIVDIEEDMKGPLLIDELNSDVIACDEEEEDENLNQHNTAFVLDIDWNDPRNDAYYDPHDDCVEYPSFLHDNDGYGGYGSNYDGGYDSY